MEMKQAYQEKISAQIREWEAKIDALKAKADKVGAEQKIKYQETIESLHQRQRDLRDRMEELRLASEDSWEQTKGRVETVWQDLKTSVDEAMDKFKKDA